jgi:WD40 repeat protein
MMRKSVFILVMLAVVIVLAACGTPAATAIPAPTQSPATPLLVTQAAIEAATSATAPGVTPGGGLLIRGGTPQAEVIGADTAERLGEFFKLPLPTFITSLSFSPDGKLLAAGTPAGGQIFDVEGQKQLATFAPKMALQGVLWSPDGKLLAAIPGDPAAQIVLWDVQANAESEVLKGKLAGQSAFAFSPNGSQAASGGASGLVTVWNLPGGDAATTFNLTDAGADASGGQPIVGSLSFSADGATLIVMSSPVVEMLRWDLAGDKALPKASAGSHIAAPVAIGLLAPGDTSHVYWWSRGDVIAVDIATDQETGRLQTEDFIQSAAFSPDGKLLAAASAGTVNNAMSPLVKLWDTTTGKDVRSLTGLTQVPTALVFSPDGTRLAIGVSTDGIAIWGIVQNK